MNSMLFESRAQEPRQGLEITAGEQTIARALADQATTEALAALPALSPEHEILRPLAEHNLERQD